YPEIHRMGDPPALDGPHLQRQAQFRAKRGDVLRAWPAHDVLEEDRILDRSCHRAFVAIEVEVEWRILRVAAIGRLEADNAAAGGRNPDRAADIRARREGRRAGGKRRTRSSRRSAGRELRVPRVARDPPEAGPGVPRTGELRRRSPGMDDAARAEDPSVHF